MLSNVFSFKRKYFVKDLLSPDSLIKNASTLEFESFNEFARTFLKDRLYSLDSVNMIIVPAENAEEVKLLLSIKPEVRPFLVIYLKDFTIDTRKAFEYVDKTAILCDSMDIPDLVEQMRKEPSEQFCKFLSCTYGYFRGYVDAGNVKELLHIYSDSFFTLPFFCIADIRWDFHSFEKMPLVGLHEIVYLTKFIYNNLMHQQRIVDFSSFGFDGERKYSYDYMRVPGAKRLNIANGCLYADGIPDSMLDMYSDVSKDATEVPLKEIDSLRHFYDLKLSKQTGLDDMSFVSINQNKKCMGNPAMIPYLCSIITRTLNGGNV